MVNNRWQNIDNTRSISKSVTKTGAVGHDPGGPFPVTLAAVTFPVVTGTAMICRHNDEPVFVVGGLTRLNSPPELPDQIIGEVNGVVLFRPVAKAVADIVSVLKVDPGQVGPLGANVE